MSKKRDWDLDNWVGWWLVMFAATVVFLALYLHGKEDCTRMGGSYVYAGRSFLCLTRDGRVLW